MEKQKLVSDCLAVFKGQGSFVLSYSFGFAKYLRWSGFMITPGFRSAWKLCVSTMMSESSDCCVLRNSARSE